MFSSNRCSMEAKRKHRSREMQVQIPHRVRVACRNYHASCLGQLTHLLAAGAGSERSSSADTVYTALNWSVVQPTLSNIWQPGTASPAWSHCSGDSNVLSALAFGAAAGSICWRAPVDLFGRLLGARLYSWSEHQQQ
jgi:hypothetical protein